MDHPSSFARRRQFLQWVLSSGAVAALPATQAGCFGGAAPCTIGQWSNAVGTLSVHPSLLMFPTSAGEIAAIVKQAEGGKKRVRMTGSGHSFSDVAVSEDYLLLPTRLDDMLEVDRNRLKAAYAADKHLVRVQSGITIRKLNAELDARQLALANLGGYDGQTIAGVAMTATHGSGLAFGPIASQIASMQIVVAGGEVVQIEPADGITDPQKFPGTLEDDAHVPVRLVQNDDMFAAASVSMGCMGIVYAVVLKTVDRFWIREKRSVAAWSDLAKPGGVIERLVTGKKINASGDDPDHIEIYVNPYVTRKPGGDGHTCIYTERYRLAEPPARTADNSRRGLEGGTGNFLTNPDTVRMAGDALRGFFDGARGDVLHGALDVMLNYLRDDDYTDLGYRVFNLGDANRFRVYGIEAAFAIEQTVKATERMFELAREFEGRGVNHTVPVSLRFVAPSKSHLAMQYGRATCMMEIGILVGARGAADLLKGYEEAFIREFGARPHWGLDLDVLKSEQQVAKLYPAFPQWKAVYANLNRSGVFSGRFTDRIGISIAP